MVTTYGIMEIKFGMTMLLCAARDLTPLHRPNSRHAFVAPSGENLPKITAAIAISLSYDDAWTELVDRCQCYERSAKSGEESGKDHADVTDFVNIDTKRLTCLRMLADCS